MDKTILRDQINTYLTCCHDIGLSPETIKTKYYVLRMFSNQVDISSMTDCDNQHLTAWLHDMLERPAHDRVGENTRRKYQKEVITFVKFLREDGICDPPIKLSRVRPIKRSNLKTPLFFTPEQINTVIKQSSFRDGLMIRLMFDTGLRLAEFRNIRVEDIDFNNRSIVVIGKGSKLGRVYFTRETRNHLSVYIHLHRLLPTDFLWASDRNNGLPYVCSRLRDIMKEAFAKAGYPDFHPHALRHSFATDLINRGATIQEVQHLMRHSEARITETYIHNLHNRLGDTYDRLKDDRATTITTVKAEEKEKACV